MTYHVTSSGRSSERDGSSSRPLLLTGGLAGHQLGDSEQLLAIYMYIVHHVLYTYTYIHVCHNYYPFPYLSKQFSLNARILINLFLFSPHPIGNEESEQTIVWSSATCLVKSQQGPLLFFNYYYFLDLS